MEMSHSGLVRLPAKEVGVEAPREFESPHLRKNGSPGTQQRGRGFGVGPAMAAEGAVPGRLPSSRPSGRRPSGRGLR